MADNKVEVIISAKSDDKGLNQFIHSMEKAQTELKQTAQTAENSTGSFSGLGGAVTKLVGILGGLAILHKVTGWLKEGVMGAIEEERALNALTVMVRQFDPTMQGLSSTLDIYVSKMKEVGMADEEVYNGIRQLIPITRDYENATKGVSLAWDLSVATGWSYQQSLDLVAGLMANKPRSLKQANQELGIKAASCQEALDKLFGQFDGYSAKINDHLTELNKMQKWWADFKGWFGGTVLTAFDYWSDETPRKMRGMAIGILEALNKLTPAGTTMEGGLLGLIASLKKLDAEMSGLGGGKTYGPTMPPQANKKYGSDTSGGGAGGKTSPLESIGMASTDDIDNDLKATLNKVKGFYLAVGNLAQMAKENREFLDDDYMRHLDKVNALLLKDQSKMDAKELKAYQKQLKTEEQYFKKHLKVIDGLAEASSEAEIAIGKTTARENAGTFADYASIAGQMTEQLFAKNKKAQIAAAVINTIAGAARAFADYQYPMSLAIAALALVSGYAQVSKIQSTEMSAERGFDIPAGMNPITRLHEREMVLPKAQADVIRALAERPSTSIRHGDSSQVIQVNALTGAYGLRAASKKMKQGDRLYKSMRVR